MANAKVSGSDLTQQEAHFAFGRNWAAYAEKISEQQIDEAISGLSRLMGNDRLDGKRFLDVGSGSGLHSLAAIRLGAREVVAVDIDPDSVATTRAVLARHAPGANFYVERVSVFEIYRHDWGNFDVVYSWGVLHHTGDMVRAIRCAAAQVRRGGGLMIFALYRRVWMDVFWKAEKRWYAKAPPRAQAAARAVYIALYRLALLLTGRTFKQYLANYRSNRGMDYYHDVHDWLGGWPYESISPSEVKQLMAELGFAHVRVFARKGRFLGRDPGFLGSGCDEYVFQANAL